MRLLRQGFAVAALAAGMAAFALAGEVVILKGGVRVELKQPMTRRGNTAYLTRADGTLFSVPVSEIDREATAAANTTRSAAPASPTEASAATPAEAARIKSEAPRARVRITDADVSHPLEDVPTAAETPAEAAGPGGPKVEVADYTQEKNGAALIVRGSLRNPGQGTAESVRMQVSAVDEKGAPIDGVNASLSKGVLEAGQTIEFTASLNVGEKTVGSLRFSPQWTQPRPPAAPTPQPGTAAAAAASARPTPRPTPYGQGTLYAPPVANAPSRPPADGKTGYIPGAANPDQQPKQPDQP